ncbi:hypothetical protein BF49_1928 [Bradyrhizobium sp.]|nr:hypothetical protein BF49_1928 [Bradyrhizobium sp.]
MNHTGRRQTITPILMRGTAQRYRRQCTQGGARGKFRCLIPLADFPPAR